MNRTREEAYILKQRLPEGSVVQVFSEIRDAIYIRLGYRVFEVARHDSTYEIFPGTVWSEPWTDRILADTLDEVEALIADLDEDEETLLPYWASEFVDLALPAFDSGFAELFYQPEAEVVSVQSLNGSMSLHLLPDGDFRLRYRSTRFGKTKAEIEFSDSDPAIAEARNRFGDILPDWKATDIAEVFQASPEPFILSVLVTDPRSGFRCEVASKGQSGSPHILGVPVITGDTPQEALDKVMLFTEARRHSELKS